MMTATLRWPKAQLQPKAVHIRAHNNLYQPDAIYNLNPNPITLY